MPLRPRDLAQQGLDLLAGDGVRCRLAPRQQREEGAADRDGPYAALDPVARVHDATVGDLEVDPDPVAACVVVGLPPVRRALEGTLAARVLEVIEECRRVPHAPDPSSRE